MEEDTNNTPTQPQKILNLISRFKPVEKKVTIFFLSSSVAGVLICICLLVRAYFYNKFGLIFFHQDKFIDSKIFRGYEGEIFIYAGYFLQGIAINDYMIKRFSVLTKKLNKFIVLSGAVMLWLGSWLYCTSITSGFVEDGSYTAALYGVFTLLNVILTHIDLFGIDENSDKNWLPELLLLGCLIRTVLLLKNSF